MSSIHGHEVLNMMLESETAFTTESLVAAIADRFGADSRFHTCSAEDMTAHDLVAFLAERGKFVAADAGFTTAPERMCQH